MNRSIPSNHAPFFRQDGKVAIALEFIDDQTFRFPVGGKLDVLAPGADYSQVRTWPQPMARQDCCLLGEFAKSLEMPYCEA